MERGLRSMTTRRMGAVRADVCTSTHASARGARAGSGECTRGHSRRARLWPRSPGAGDEGASGGGGGRLACHVYT